MNHLPVVPILLPFVAAIVCLAMHRSARAQRCISIGAAILLAPVAMLLLDSAGRGEISVYALGDWQPPFGIVLVLDRLSALMVALATALAAPVLLHATATGIDGLGRHFHPLFQLQLAGLNGAFLTGDVFNLFVFFEVLLLASYGLLAHGQGPLRARAGINYVALNLAGSTLFLVAVALLYGSLGTLNMADIATRLKELPPGEQALVGAASVLLLLVFALKAALLPLSLWLPRVYSSATAPVAALFAIMTKVGVYCILRLTTVALADAPATRDLVEPWLLPFAIGTIVIGTVGALAARRLALIVANLVVVSTGMLLAPIAIGTAAGAAASLYYLVHTTLASAAFFLLAGRIAAERGEAGDSLDAGPPMADAAVIGSAYLVLAVAVSGMPPLSGFIGKLMVMQALEQGPLTAVAWTAILMSGLMVALVLARAASVYFWEPRGEATAPVLRSAWAGFAVFLLLAASPLLTVAAAPVASYARATAEQLHTPAVYIDAVLGGRAATGEEARP